MNRKITINSKVIGDNEPTFVVFEAGPTHQGLDSAKRLVDVAVEAGADAIKFQVLDVDRLMSDKTVMFSYGVKCPNGESEIVGESLYDILKRREMTHTEWRILIDYCKGKGIPFFATASFPDEVEFLVDAGVPSIKIASADINHIPLIKYVASKGVNVQIDTGNADLWEVERAVSCIEEAGNHNIIIHHCPSGYPAYQSSIFLRMIITLKHMFPDHPIAFSDHSPGWDMDVAAVALGANLVEKTITLDCTTRSCEHMFSLEPEQAKRFVEVIRNTETALGSTRRVLPTKAKESKLAARRSIFVTQDLLAGHIIGLDDIDFRRPGYGIPPDVVNYVVNRRLNKDIARGHMLEWSDLE